MFPRKSGLAGDFGHTLGARYHSERMSDVGGIVGLKCFCHKDRNGLIRSQILGRIIVGYPLAMFLTPFRRPALRRFDVPILCALVSAAQEDNEHISALLKVDSVARTIVDSQLADALANRFHITGVPKCKSIQTRGNQGKCTLVFEFRSPPPECLGLLEFNHGRT